MNIRIYIIYHDLESKEIATKIKHDWELIEGLDVVIILNSNKSQYLENEIYNTLYQCKNDWIHYNYVGIVSYSILLKLESFSKQKINFNWRSIINELEKNALDVIGLYGVQYVKNNYPISMVEGACFQHGLNFSRSWYILLKDMGFEDDQIYNSNILPFLCNWWISKPKFMLDYINFYKSCINVIETNQTLQQLLQSNSFYNSGNLSPSDLNTIFKKPFYTLFPFIFERLPCYYFYHNSVKIGYFMQFMLQI